MFCGLPYFFRNDSSTLTFSDVGNFFRVELSGNVCKFKKKKEILLRTFTSSMRHRVRKIHQNSRRSRAGTTKNCLLCVASAKKKRKGEGRGKNRKKPGGEGEFSFLPNPFSFCPSLPIPFRRLKLLCLSILQLLERP